MSKAFFVVREERIRLDAYSTRALHLQNTVSTSGSISFDGSSVERPE
jgi:hypothetical protein